MTRDDTALRNPANWRAEGDFLVYQATDAPWTAAVKATALDAIGCRLWEVQATRADGATVDLKATAELLAGRVTGLLEPLRLVEADNEYGLALLRSDAMDQASYTELLLHRDGGFELRRYRAATPGQRRQQVAFSVTHEALAKLLHDLTT